MGNSAPAMRSARQTCVDEAAVWPRLRGTVRRIATAEMASAPNWPHGDAPLRKPMASYAPAMRSANQTCVDEAAVWPRPRETARRTATAEMDSVPNWPVAVAPLRKPMARCVPGAQSVPLEGVARVSADLRWMLVRTSIRLSGISNGLAERQSVEPNPVIAPNEA